MAATYRASKVRKTLESITAEIDKLEAMLQYEHAEQIGTMIRSQIRGLEQSKVIIRKTFGYYE